MQSSFYHVSINVSDPNFYKNLLAYIGFKIVVEYPDGFGMSDGSASIWVFETNARYKDREFHRKETGLNHLAFKVSSKE